MDANFTIYTHHVATPFSKKFNNIYYASLDLLTRFDPITIIKVKIENTELTPIQLEILKESLKLKNSDKVRQFLEQLEIETEHVIKAIISFKWHDRTISYDILITDVSQLISWLYKKFQLSGTVTEIKVHNTVLSKEGIKYIKQCVVERDSSALKEFFSNLIIEI
jgi:hypothetical protein